MALVEATAFSTPALIGITISEVRAMVELSTFTIEIIFMPFSCAVSIASNVSAVSPDCETQIRTLSGVRNDFWLLNSEPNLNVVGFWAIIPKRYSATIQTFPAVPHPARYTDGAFLMISATDSSVSACWLIARERVSFCSMISLIMKCGNSPFSALSTSSSISIIRFWISSPLRVS